jgi:hypothetical protein
MSLIIFKSITYHYHSINITVQLSSLRKPKLLHPCLHHFPKTTKTLAKNLQKYRLIGSFVSLFFFSPSLPKAFGRCPKVIHCLCFVKLPAVLYIWYIIGILYRKTSAKNFVKQDYRDLGRILVIAARLLEILVRL